MKVLSVALSVFFFSFWKAHAAAGEFKFGYVDLQKALNETEEGKKAKSELEKKFEEKSRALDTRNMELKKQKEELDRQKAVLKEEVYRAKEEEFRKKVKEFQEEVRQSQIDMERMQMTMTSDILVKLKEVVETIGKTEGFTAIFERSAILFAVEAHDLTDRVIKAYNSSKTKQKR